MHVRRRERDRFDQIRLQIHANMGFIAKRRLSPFGHEGGIGIAARLDLARPAVGAWRPGRRRLDGRINECPFFDDQFMGGQLMEHGLKHRVQDAGLLQAVAEAPKGGFIGHRLIQRQA